MRGLNFQSKRFKRDEGGAFMTLFAVMAITLVVTAGAVVDFVRIQQARNTAQLALDAAALALQPDIYTKTTTELEADAEDLLVERLTGTDVTAEIYDVEVDTDDGSIYLKAQLDIPLAFVSLVGIPDMTVDVISKATRKKLYLEVAFVLDNSGSMASYSRMTNLKSAATAATNIIFYGSSSPAYGAEAADNVKAGVVPFTVFVNVGSGYKTASWIDGNGDSSFSYANFDDDDDESTPYTTPVDRFALYDELGESWDGCVESRPYPYNVDDTTPTTSDGDTLFLPVFAADEPDSGSYYYNDYIDDEPSNCDEYVGVCSCTTTTSSLETGLELGDAQIMAAQWGGGWDGGGWDGGGWDGGGGTTTTSCTLTYPDGSSESGDENLCSCSGSGSTVTCDYYEGPAGLSSRELQERLCKYEGASPSSTYGGGPNGMCLSTSLLPLTDSPSSVISRINSMSANGATNIHAGAIWGYRILSPTEPFTEGREYDTATSKVMILMTDGENTYYDSSNINGTSYYYPFGFLWNNDQDSRRLGESGLDNSDEVTDRMDELTVESCTNAKNDGITVYTIGLNPPNTSTRNMLISCASDSSKAYFPTQASELNDVFEDIANQLSELRLEL